MGRLCYLYVPATQRHQRHHVLFVRYFRELQFVAVPQCTDRLSASCRYCFVYYVDWHAQFQGQEVPVNFLDKHVRSVYVLDGSRSH